MKVMKKKLLLIAVILILSFQLNAQFDKGKILTGLTSTIGIGHGGTDLFNLGLNSFKIKYGGVKVDIDKTFSFNFLPRAGYLVIDNLVVGLDLLVSMNSEKSSEGDDRESETTMAIGPFARYYYPLEKIYPFVEANVGFGSWKEKWSNGSDGVYKEGLMIFGIGAGASAPLGEKVLIDALIGYASQIWNDKEEDTKYIYGTIGLRIGFILLLAPEK
jgi:hypothetical protein